MINFKNIPSASICIDLSSRALKPDRSLLANSIYLFKKKKGIFKKKFQMKYFTLNEYNVHFQ